ncbi:hypothetical protein Q5P01_024801 [Channa striata]|uniref:Uncharacterized protein n=1 Tax=Channa striata TaxID=64152 RepID=A0AA88J8D6_CHASR|nr:hypothetical protein Q5P01_024801 [Channa striata]
MLLRRADREKNGLHWGLLTEYISNLRTCNSVPALLFSLLFRCGGREKKKSEREKERALDHLLCLK